MNNITMDENHIYRVNNKIVPSVSNLLMEAGLIDENVIKFADTTLGSAVHKACELSDKGTLDLSTCELPVARRLAQWCEFLSAKEADIVLNEESLYSKLGFCGTPDRLLRIGGKYILVDIKTSKARYKSTKVQLMFYKKMVEETVSEEIDEVWEVVLLEDEYIIVVHNELTKEESIVRSILNIHYYKETK